MARAKIKRGSTNVDMTAMCDVAFLLLTFFILVGKFKSSEAIAVTPPSSVSNKVAPEKDYFMVSIDKDNKAFVSMDDDFKEDVLNEVGKMRNLSLDQSDIDAFKQSDFVGVPLNQLKQFDKLSSDEQAKVSIPGIPYDSTNNELKTWITAAVQAGQGKKVNWLIKADGDAKYPTFKKAIDAFKANDVYKYSLVTNAEEVPEGSELWKVNMKRLLEGKGAKPQD